ncbi:MAG: LapA family protein [Spirochaetaceae bacterium]|nr:MAG: LapA family protein [Spirochaetaceae bacterium]
MGKKKLDRVKIGIVLGLSVILVLIIAQNTAPIPGRFLWFTGEVSAVVLLILSSTVGFILGLFVALFTRREDVPRREERRRQASGPASGPRDR